MEKCYNFTDFAVTLNEPEEGVAPTDSRLRPDQRFMEEGAWDEANTTKVQLEEKQRANRRKRESEAAEAAQRGESLIFSIMLIVSDARNFILISFIF